MNYEQVKILLKSNTTVKLITADNAPLIISFFFRTFKTDNKSTIAESDIISQLDSHLYSINQSSKIYPREAKAYITDWCQEGSGYLRRYYENDDEPLYELTPATEVALKWIEDLDKPEFIGTESRLRLLFDMLRELSSKTKHDAQTRILELEAEKARIEKEIENAHFGYFDILDDTQIKERYINAEETAKRLLADFRQVEQNFRDLDSDFKRKIIGASNTKAKVLDELFQQQDYLWQTDQGKSFKAFWEFLRSSSKQQELENLLEEVFQLPTIQSLKGKSSTIHRIKNYLIEAGDKVNKSTGTLSEQLRKYVEHKSFLENKRILVNIDETLKIISEKADTLSKSDSVMELNDTVNIKLITGRDFEDIVYRPSQPIKFKELVLEDGIAGQNNELLFNQFTINVEDLRLNIRKALQNKTQVSLKELIKEHQVNKGVAEIIGYIEIATKDKRHIYSSESEDEILISNTSTGKSFKVKFPHIIFCK